MFQQAQKIHKTKQQQKQQQKNTQKPNYYPIQHPKNLEDQNNKIYTYERPPKFLTPLQEVQYEKFLPQEGKKLEVISPDDSKYLETAIVGPPNAGKSSLFNKILGKNISATSNKQSTTYENILGFYTNFENSTQVVFHDTPGITKNYKSSNYFVTKAWSVINECKRVIFVVDANKTVTDEVRESLKRLNRMEYDQIQQDFLNKINLKDELQNQESSIEDLLKQVQLYTSQINDSGNEAIMSKPIPKVNDWQFNPEANSENSVVDQLEEIAKSCLFNRFYYEIPYQVGIQLKEFVERSDGLIMIKYDFDVRNKIQVGLLAGLKGRNKNILIEHIQAELMKIYNREFIVKLRFKIRKDSLDRTNESGLQVKGPNEGEEQVKKSIQVYEKTKEDLAQKIKVMLNL
ncbi:P-loop containing nucleoside triphosphate hydrolase [Pseudocohnilembus persalinus]|uniref:p-loop containing nucleoside triphosphate hydrolase n=1 Tax=Pseudocohnilembus persalinus TaxID=266149 RepID=A0A0V0QK32_PSEPJ|nr:P-loop containing nucleoside triphosphate hydrolase [Pseudocohnilembus persalinus]|eukprot:KRX02671.1 P-loop containing nucleoside triphosphate hydrolase [Pseudocohnilembus persalinus]